MDSLPIRITNRSWERCNQHKTKPFANHFEEVFQLNVLTVHDDDEIY